MTPTRRDLLAAATIAVMPGSGDAVACGLELVLALDVSRSVINAEYNLQRGGLAEAFRHPEVVQAVGWIPGGVMTTVTQWSGPENQAQSIGWRHLQDPESVLAFADEIDAVQRRFYAAYTAVGDALWHASALGATNPVKCGRRVIDISGDGASNRGRDPRAISRSLAAKGVTINAMAIQGASPDPAEYYAKHVIAGSGAFVETAASFDDYGPAILRKLLRELTPSLAALR